jgi:phospholipase C
MRPLPLCSLQQWSIWLYEWPASISTNTTKDGQDKKSYNQFTKIQLEYRMAATFLLAKSFHKGPMGFCVLMNFSAMCTAHNCTHKRQNSPASCNNSSKCMTGFRWTWPGRMKDMHTVAQSMGGVLNRLKQQDSSICV